MKKWQLAFLMLVLLGIFVAIPIALVVLLPYCLNDPCGLPLTGKDWFAFLGSYLGGGFTVVSIIVTIAYTTSQSRKDFEKQLKLNRFEEVRSRTLEVLTVFERFMVKVSSEIDFMSNVNDVGILERKIRELEKKCNKEWSDIISEAQQLPPFESFDFSNAEGSRDILFSQMRLLVTAQNIDSLRQLISPTSRDARIVSFKDNYLGIVSQLIGKVSEWESAESKKITSK